MLLLALLLGPVLLAGPAQADTLASSGSISPGEAVTVTCPEHSKFIEGTVTFYRHEGAKKPLATSALSPAQWTEVGLPAGAISPPAPKGSSWYAVTHTCQPLSSLQLSTTITMGPGAEAVVECGTNYWLDSSTVSTTNPELSYTITLYGVQVLNPTSTEQTTTVSGTCWSF